MTKYAAMIDQSMNPSAIKVTTAESAKTAEHILLCVLSALGG
jgi:hypothetical protein